MTTSDVLFSIGDIRGTALPLYIKDDATAALVAELAQAVGTT
ncbi:hypothetical protein [Methylobacterium sp.]|nr:hypothetical protein [Methylobacterium sp.]